MASNPQNSSTGNGTSLRTRGRSMLLICVLMINVILVAVAPTMRPGPATAQDSANAVAKKVDPASDPNPEQPARTDAESTPAESTPEASPSATADAEAIDRLWNGLAMELAGVEDASPDDADQSAPTDPSNNTVEPPLHVAQVEHPNAGHDQGPAVESPANADPAPAADPGHDSVAQTDPQPVPPQVDVPGDTDLELSQSAAAALPSLQIVNPVENGGTVFYLVDGNVHSLAPGEAHDLGEAGDYKVEFHRGDEFGDAQFVVKSGTYQFRVEDTGWHLAAVGTSRTDG